MGLELCLVQSYLPPELRSMYLRTGYRQRGEEKIVVDSRETDRGINIPFLARNSLELGGLSAGPLLEIDLGTT